MKKFAALLLALVMALSLVACGDKAPADNGGEGLFRLYHPHLLQLQLHGAHHLAGERCQGRRLYRVH